MRIRIRRGQHSNSSATAYRFPIRARSWRQTAIGLLFALPWVVGFLSLFLYPLVASIYYSLTRYDLLTPPWFVGLENYRQLFADKLVRKALYNTAYLSWCIVPLNNLAGLVLALLLDTRLRLQSFFRTIFYLPSLVPVVALSVMWRYILDPNFGLLNGILAAMGLPGQGWLSNPHLSKPSLVLISMWGVGGVTILYLAALQGVPVSLYEAARIDGASQRHCIWHITIPMISPTILFCVITGLIGTFQYFTQAYMLTPWGGAAYSTLTYAVYLFENAFSWMRMGYASAMAWVLFGVTSVLTLLLFRTSARWVYYGYGSDR